MNSQLPPKHDRTPHQDVSPAELSDMELVVLTRAGDQGAFAVLWSRHYSAAIRAARAITQKHDAEDMVQEAFTRIFMATQNGKGPQDVFRAYLYTVLRSVSMSWSKNDLYEAALEELPLRDEPAYSFAGQVVAGTVMAKAFNTLKSEWRAVLWYLDVEGAKPKEAATLLGLSANSTSALAYRAREALRSSWLQAHVNSEAADPACKWVVERLGAYNRGSLPARAKGKAEEHLTVCLKCSILLEEVDHVSKNLGIALLPALMGPAAFAYLDGLAKPSDLATISADPAAQDLSSQAPLTEVLAASRSAHAMLGKVPMILLGSAAATAGILVVGFYLSSARSPLPVSMPATPATQTRTPALPTSVPATSAPEVAVVPENGNVPVVPRQPAVSNVVAPPVSATVPESMLDTLPLERPVQPVQPDVAQPDTVQPAVQPTISDQPGSQGGPAVIPAVPSVVPVPLNPSPPQISQPPIEPTVAPPTQVPTPDPIPSGEPAPTVQPAPSTAPVQTVSPAPTPAPTIQPSPAAPSPTEPPASTSPPVQVVAAPVIEPVVQDGLFLPVLKGTGEPGATVSILLDTTVVGKGLVDAQGRWSITPKVVLNTSQANTGKSLIFTASQSLDGAAPLLSEPTDAVALVMPEISSITYENGLGNVGFSGPEGSLVEVLIDGVSTQNFHTMTGRPVKRALPVLDAGSHNIMLRFVDAAHQRHGASLSRNFMIN